MGKKMRFDSYHPVINLIYFGAVLAGTVCFCHPVFLMISYVSMFLYSVKLNGKRSCIFNCCLIPLIFCYAGSYSGYHHFGITDLGTNFIGNHMTFESVVFGLVQGTQIAAVIMIFSCIFTIVSTDKIIYLFGRISPKLSLFLSILLRSIPRMRERGTRIDLARKGVGKSCSQGNLFRRFRNACDYCSILITWTLEDFVDTAASMKARGYSLKGRTAFSIYRFDNRDRSLVIVFSFCIIMTVTAAALDQTVIIYDPEIIMNRITPVSFLFYLCYAFFLLLPLLLQIAGERHMERSRSIN